MDIFSKHEPRGRWLAEGRQDGDDRTQEQVHQEDAQGGHVQVSVTSWTSKTLKEDVFKYMVNWHYPLQVHNHQAWEGGGKCSEAKQHA